MFWKFYIFWTLIFVLIFPACTNELNFHSSIPPQNPAILINAIVMIADDFSDEQKSIIMGGAEQWVIAGNGQIKIDYIPPTWENVQKYSGKMVEGKCVELIVFNFALSLNKEVEKMDKILGKYTLGYTDRKECVYTKIWLVEDRLPNEIDLETISAHEMGHAFQLNHVKGFTSIMSRIYEPQINEHCLGKLDIEQFCTIYHCNIDNFRYCQRKHQWNF